MNPLVLVQQAFTIFSRERAASRGAAIAFYTVTSMAPILVIVIAVAGLIFGNEAARGALFEQFSSLLGSAGATVLQNTLASTTTTGGVTAGVISVATLLFGASGVFLELEDALNALWGSSPPEGFWTLARARLTSFGLVIALGFLLMVSLAVDAALKAFGASLHLSAGWLVLANTIASLALMTLLFAAIFKYLPSRSIAWRAVLPGAAVTALLFEAGKFLIGLYLGRSQTMSALGAAGALLGMLFWVYYSAQIFLFGAALTVAQGGATELPARHSTALRPSSGQRETQTAVESTARTRTAFALLTAVLMVLVTYDRKKK